MNPEYRGVISAAHPGLVGHFPGNPVVPGVVILDEVAQALAAWQPGLRSAGMPIVKFLAPLRPDQVFIIHLIEYSAGGIRFECSRDDNGQLLAQGRIAVACVDS
jgi:3-hydroxyacyl-[acyl-carrier-protein] dehydratase